MWLVIGILMMAAGVLSNRGGMLFIAGMAVTGLSSLYYLGIALWP
jgi:hypothetical protein